MLRVIKERDEGDASGSSKKGVVLLLALALVAAAGCAATSCGLQARIMALQFRANRAVATGAKLSSFHRDVPNQTPLYHGIVNLGGIELRLAANGAQHSLAPGALLSTSNAYLSQFKHCMQAADGGDSLRVIFKVAVMNAKGEVIEPTSSFVEMLTSNVLANIKAVADTTTDTSTGAWVDFRVCVMERWQVHGQADGAGGGGAQGD